MQKVLKVQELVKAYFNSTFHTSQCSSTFFSFLPLLRQCSQHPTQSASRHRVQTIGQVMPNGLNSIIHFQVVSLSLPLHAPSAIQTNPRSMLRRAPPSRQAGTPRYGIPTILSAPSITILTMILVFRNLRILVVERDIQSMWSTLLALTT
jgi:hypothetical protein